MNSKITVSGNIVSELSEKIPSNIIALNELIKNAYDAGAKGINIILNTFNRTLIVDDDGEGMDEKDIDTLFHISNSNKRYGELNKYDRYTQGSKGLGFLSVFKFGRVVKWETKKDKGLKFLVDYDELLQSNNISDFSILIEEDEMIKKGTKISITLDEYNASSLLKYFSEERNYKKIVNAFDDKKFVINLDINGIVYSSLNTLPIKDNLPDNQLYYVTYNSKNQEIKYFFNGYNIINEKFPFTSNKYELDIELIIFQLQPYGKGKIDQLYINPQGDLTPLLYVNSNLFNNYDLFDPNVMKNIKIGHVLNQMIGFIRIISNDKLISFNSDRSQFLQNELTDSIKVFLDSINKKIQEVGSNNKKYLVDFNILTVSELPQEYKESNEEELTKFIQEDFAFKNRVKIEKREGSVLYSAFGKEKVITFREKNYNSTPKIEKGKELKDKVPKNEPNYVRQLKPAKINIKMNEKRVQIPSNQLDLREEIVSVLNSKGEYVDHNEIEIKVDGQIMKIVESIKIECTKLVEYNYLDVNTGIVVENLKLNFYQPQASIKLAEVDSKLITLPSREDYKINYNVNVGLLIEQINSLALDKYKEVIACSLRAIFDLSIDSLCKSSKFISFFTTTKFEDKVIQVIEYLNGKKSYLSQISISTKIDFQSLSNMLDVSTFRSGISSAHLGAHKSSSYVTDDSLKGLAKLAGLFVVVVNEMLNNVNIK